MGWKQSYFCAYEIASKKKMKRFLIIALLISSGCATVHGVMHVESEPKGARIEIDNEYKGQTPLDIPFQYDEWQGPVFGGMCVMKALPTEPGHCVQSKVFIQGNRIPQNIFFDMRLCPVNPSVDVNINR